MGAFKSDVDFLLLRSSWGGPGRGLVTKGNI